jgi:hypothetical protein
MGHDHSDSFRNRVYMLFKEEGNSLKKVPEEKNLWQGEA